MSDYIDILKGLAVVGAAVGVVAWVTSSQQTDPPVRSIPSADTQRIELPDPPKTRVSLKTFRWKKGGFDSVMIASFTIQNNNEYAVKDIDVGCRLLANSGTEIDSARQTIYERVPAGSTR